jgi:hypothetical protein
MSTWNKCTSSDWIASSVGHVSHCLCRIAIAFTSHRHAVPWAMEALLHLQARPHITAEASSSSVVFMPAEY